MSADTAANVCSRSDQAIRVLQSGQLECAKAAGRPDAAAFALRKIVQLLVLAVCKTLASCFQGYGGPRDVIKLSLSLVNFSLYAIRQINLPSI